MVNNYTILLIKNAFKCCNILSFFLFCVNNPESPNDKEKKWQARQDLNLQPPVLETGALPLELRTCNFFIYFISLCIVCFLQ